MSLVLKDRVRETTTVLGTNDATLLGAVTGFQAFSVVGNGNTCYYTISDQSGGNWEVGIGTYSTVGPTLARTTILASSNSGSIVSFPAGTKDVFLTLPAEVAVVSSNNPSTAGYVLSSNGTGVAPSWVAGTSITVGAAGSNTQVQYNNSGVLGASSNFTFDGTNIGLAGGTANGVAYLNGSKVLTTGSALTFDGASLAIGTTPSATRLYVYDSSGATQVLCVDGTGAPSAIFRSSGTQRGGIGQANGVVAGASSSDFGIQSNANLVFATNGTSEQMRLTSTGLGIGTSSPSYKLNVVSSGNGTNSRFTNGSSIVDIYNDSGTSYIGDAGVNNSIGFTTSNSSITFYTSSGTERMRLDSSGNLGLGVTPSAWGSGFKAVQVGARSAFFDTGSTTLVGNNCYYDGTNYKYIAAAYASAYDTTAGQHRWYAAASGSIGGTITFTQAMTLDASGNLLLGTTTSTGLTTNQFQLGTTSNANSGVQVLSNTTGTGGIYFGDSTSGAGRYSGYLEYSHSTNAMLFTTDATERMRIDSSGNVGIGTSSPGYALDIRRGAGAEAYILLAGNNGGTSSGLIIGQDSAGASQLYQLGANPIRFATNGTERMRIDSSGNVGIGSSSPNARLQIVSALDDHVVQTYIRFSRNGYPSANYGASISASAGSIASQNNLVFNTSDGTNAPAERVRIDGDGNVGIGTSSPTEKLCVAGNLLFDQNRTITLNGVGTALITNPADAGIVTLNTGTTAGYVTSININGGGASPANTILFNTASTERMRIDSSGNVFVGGTTALAGSKEAVYGDTSNQGSGTYPATLELIDTRAYNSTSPQAGGGVAFGYKYTSGGNYALGPSIQGFKENSTDGNYAAGLKFSTRPNGSNPAEAMRIDSSGNLLVGTTAVSAARLNVFSSDVNKQIVFSNNETYYGSVAHNAGTGMNEYRTEATGGHAFFKGTESTAGMTFDSSGNLLVGTASLSGVERLSVSGSATGAVVVFNRTSNIDSSLRDMVVFNRGATSVGSITCSNSATAYNTSSDYRLKENIQPMQNALATVAQLNPVTYTWKADGSDGQGFIAHELQAVVPDCVTGEKDAVDAEGKPVYQGIDTSFLVATLTKAIQELEARVKQLEGK